MSKYTVADKCGAMAAEGHKTRRAALRAFVGASAFAIPTINAIASATGDPVFAAIERHKAAYEVLQTTRFTIDDMMYNPEREVSDAEWDAYDRGHKTEEAAFDELLTYAPETNAGVRAIVAHLIFLDDGRLSDKMKQLLASLLKSRVLAS